MKYPQSSIHQSFITKVLHVNNKSKMPYGLTAFQVNTWLQQKSTNSSTP